MLVLQNSSPYEIEGIPRYCTEKGPFFDRRGGLLPCGPFLFAAGETRGVSAASMDDPSELEPVAEIWTASAQPRGIT